MGRLEGDFLQELAEGLGGLLHHGGVEGAGHGQPLEFHGLALQGGQAPVHPRGLAADDALSWAVVVGHPDPALPACLLQHRLVAAHYRPHGPGTRTAALVHQLPPSGHHAEPCLEIHRPRDGQGGEFPQGKPPQGHGQGLRRFPLPQGGIARKAGDKDGWLATGAGGQLLHGAPEAQGRHLPPQEPVGLPVNSGGGGGALRQCHPHSGMLGTLPRKDNSLSHANPLLKILLKNGAPRPPAHAPPMGHASFPERERDGPGREWGRGKDKKKRRPPCSKSRRKGVRPRVFRPPRQFRESNAY